MIHRNFKVIHKEFRRESKSISAVFVILKLPLQKSNGQVQVQLALPNSNRRRRNLKWLQVTVEDVGVYRYQKSEKMLAETRRRSI